MATAPMARLPRSFRSEWSPCLRAALPRVGRLLSSGNRTRAWHAVEPREERAGYTSRLPGRNHHARNLAVEVKRADDLVVGGEGRHGDGGCSAGPSGAAIERYQTPPSGLVGGVQALPTSIGVPLASASGQGSPCGQESSIMPPIGESVDPSRAWSLTVGSLLAVCAPTYHRSPIRLLSSSCRPSSGGKLNTLRGAPSAPPSRSSRIRSDPSCASTK